MAKRSNDDVERLEKENKELKQENRLLNRRLKRLSRNQATEDSDDEEEAELSPEITNKCHECGKGYITTIILGPRKQLGCNTCGWRGKITKK